MKGMPEPEHLQKDRPGAQEGLTWKSRKEKPALDWPGRDCLLELSSPASSLHKSQKHTQPFLKRDPLLAQTHRPVGKGLGLGKPGADQLSVRSAELLCLLCRGPEARGTQWLAPGSQASCCSKDPTLPRRLAPHSAPPGAAPVGAHSPGARPPSPGARAPCSRGRGSGTARSAPHGGPGGQRPFLFCCRRGKKIRLISWYKT